MQQQEGGWGRRRLRSLRHALQGLLFFWRSEAHAKVHVAATIVVLLLGVYFGISKVEWLVVILAIALVMATEMLNTAVEKLADVVSEKPDLRVGQLKDVAAGAVLLSAIAAGVVGLFVFLPYVIRTFRG